MVNTIPLSVSVDGGNPWFFCFVELGERDGGGDSVVGGEVEDVAGAVVYPGQYFKVCSLGAFAQNALQALIAPDS